MKKKVIKHQRHTTHQVIRGTKQETYISVVDGQELEQTDNHSRHLGPVLGSIGTLDQHRVEQLNRNRAITI